MDHRQEFPIEKMCLLLGVSRAAYYNWRARGCGVPPPGTAAHDELDRAICRIYDKSQGTYGSPRITIQLNKEGDGEKLGPAAASSPPTTATAANLPRAAKATVARRMRRMGLRVRPSKRFQTTTDSNHSAAISPNLLDRDFTAAAPGRKWVSDLTYVAIQQSWAYLTVVLDLADRGIVGWTLSEGMTASETVVAAFDRALGKRPIDEGLIFHSDRGAQYASEELRRRLADHDCIQSMSRRGNCWDNAVAESFFKTLKTECLQGRTFSSLAEARNLIFRYIEGWYNTQRIHTSLGGLCPDEAYERLTRSSHLTTPQPDVNCLVS